MTCASPPLPASRPIRLEPLLTAYSAALSPRLVHVDGAFSYDDVCLPASMDKGRYDFAGREPPPDIVVLLSSTLTETVPTPAKLLRTPEGRKGSDDQAEDADRLAPVQDENTDSAPSAVFRGVFALLTEAKRPIERPSKLPRIFHISIG